MSDVTARVESSWDQDTVKVWVWRKWDKGPSRLVYSWSRHTWQFIGEGETLPDDAVLHLKPEILAAIVVAGSDFQPPNTAQARHLDDAITVRDRLLALVEQS